MSKMMFKKPADSWIYALPMGNGSLGAMVYGGAAQEKISLNHDTLWSGKPKKITKDGAHEAYLEAKQLTFEGKYVEAHQVLTDRFLADNSEIYLPFGDLFLDFNIAGEIEGYRRYLELSNALLTVVFRAGKVNYKREYFTSFPDEVLAIRISADAEKKISFVLRVESQLKNCTKCENDLYILEGECPGYSHADDVRNVMDYEYSDILEEKGILFRGGVKIINSGGSVEYSERGICVKEADSAVILLSIKTSFDGYDKFPAVKGKEYVNALSNVLLSAADKGWDTLLDRHQEDYCRLFQKISLDLGTSGREDMPTDERLQRFKEDFNDISLYTLMFDFGRYLMIASSREGSQASNLQGIWNDSMLPPWRSNYTVNINTEMNYWPTLMCGLENCYEPLIRFIQERSEAGKLTAKSFYHARGFVMHHNSDIWAHTTAVTNDATWGFWNGASGWFCHHLYDYYEYTMDRNYLEQVCYPIMKEGAMFYLDLLCDRGDGVLVICPSTSPENRFCWGDNKTVAVSKFTTMSNTIAYELFENCLKVMKELELSDSEFELELKYALDNMKPFIIGSDGRILEWNEEFQESHAEHRHISHLYALHPAHMITPEKTPALAESCRSILQKRGDGGSGWSLAWKINMYARLNDGNQALKVMKKQLEYTTETICSISGGGTYPNLFCAHPPFQIDGNFGFVSGVLEMLADVRDGELKLLPALPDEWKEGKLKGLRIKGNKIIDIEWKEGKVCAFLCYPG